MNLYLTPIRPTRAHAAAAATVLLLVAMLSAPFAFVAMAAGVAPAGGGIADKPMCYTVGVGCRPGPSMAIALFAPRR